jgi:hypothetical protein
MMRTPRLSVRDGMHVSLPIDVDINSMQNSLLALYARSTYDLHRARLGSASTVKHTRLTADQISSVSGGSRPVCMCSADLFALDARHVQLAMCANYENGIDRFEHPSNFKTRPQHDPKCSLHVRGIGLGVTVSCFQCFQK